MKMMLLAMTAVSAICAAAPAAAQYPDRYSGQYPDRYGQYNYSGWTAADFNARIDRLQARLDAGIQQGTISSREAWSLRRDLRDLRRLASQYSMNGLNAREQAYLQQRLRSVREEIRVADGGAYDRYDRDGYANGYDNRAYGTSTYDNGYYGQGGPYEEVDQADVCRSGIGGLIDSFVGNTCLRVGARATADLGAVPYQYRYQYRDGNGVYYRSDGRAVYQIDARTNTVLAVIPLPR